MAQALITPLFFLMRRMRRYSYTRVSLITLDISIDAFTDQVLEGKIALKLRKTSAINIL